VSLNERHLDVELCELRLAIGPQVLVAQAMGDLKIAIVARDHEQLLVELRRLRQGIEVARMDTAWNKVIPGPFGSAPAQERRFQLQETLAFEVIPDDLVEPVA